MVLYARTDIMAVSVPVGSGGCGATHTRPVTRGVPAKTWKLDCPGCEGHLKGGGRTRLQYTPGDARNGILPLQERVADGDPHWSSSPDTTPMTPDEQRVAKTRTERGNQQIQMIQALAALKATGINVPAEAMWLLEKELPPEVLRGKMVCLNGHDNPAGVKFCGECGTAMDTGTPLLAIESEPEEEGVAEEPRAAEEPYVVDVPLPELSALHGNRLKKMCRDRGIPDSGTKEELVERLKQYESR